MDKQKVIDILTEYNKWRRGEIENFNITPGEIGKAIDEAIKLLSR